MAENFLAQLAQSGALNIPNPMASYEKAFALMKFQREEQSAQLDDTAKVLTMFQHTLKGAQTRADYGRAYNYYSKKFPDLMEGAGVPSPDSFTDEESYQHWNIATTEGISAAIKARKGEKFPITINLPNGEIRTEEVYDEDLQKGLASGLYDPKTTFRGKLDKESYAAITERATATEAGKKPETEMVTIYGPLGETQRVPVTKGEVYEPPAGSSLTKPEKPQIVSPGQGIVNPITGEVRIPVPAVKKESALQERIRVIGEARPEWPYQRVVDEATNIKEPAGKTYLLDDQSTVRSFDGGRTYSGADGKTHKMPYNAVEVETRVTGEELTGFRQARQALDELAKPAPPGGTLKTPEEAAKGGTGPYPKLGAAIDAILGGFFGLDAFPNTQENRQQLRVLKQIGRSVLSKSARGAQWEMKQIDALFPDPDKAIRNPDSEAQKIRILRETLLTEKRFNLEAIAGPTSAKEKGDLRKVNMEMDRLLALLGPGTKPTKTPALTPEREQLMDLYAPR